MPDLDADIYRARERHWREEAALTSPGKDRDACHALADGYARLVQIIERMYQPTKMAAALDLPAFHRVG